MANEKIQNLMDKYGMGLLSEQEKLEIENLIAEDPSLRKEFLIQKEISDSLNYLGNKDLRKLLKKIKKEEIESKASKNKSILIFTLGVLFVILLGIYFASTNSLNPFIKNSSKEIYASYYTPSLLTRNIETQIHVVAFAKAYESGNYETALEIIQPHISKSNNSIVLCAAISALETGQENLALQLLDQIINEGDPYFIYHAYWFKALNHIENGEPDKAKFYLNKIVDNSKADHYKEAVKLLKEI